MKRWMGRMHAAVFTAAAAGGLVACGGGGGGEVADQRTPVPGGLRAAQPGELKAYFTDRIAQRSALGMSGTPPSAGVDVIMVATQADATTASAFAGTPLQEAGVDEDDLIKSDGERLFSLHLGNGWTTPQLAASRMLASGGLEPLGRVDLDAALAPTGMYLAREAQRIAIVSQKALRGQLAVAATSASIVPYEWSPELSLQLMDVSAPQPVPAGQIRIDGNLVSTRMIGSVLYVASTWSPNLASYAVPANLPRAEVEAKLAGLAAPQLLPTIRVNGGASQPLVAETDCLIQPANASLNLQLTSITAIDLASPSLERASRCMLGDASALYMSPTSVYLASSRDVWMGGVMANSVLPSEVKTDIHKFALQGLGIQYRGSGEVAGHLGWDAEKMPYRLSEYNGDLRVVSFTGTVGWGLPVPVLANATAPSTPPSPATITILREDGAQLRLATVSRLPNAQRPAAIGREGEQVYAVHFAGPKAYVVTFRRVDPLYMLDLSDPADPKVAGELTVPGYSDFLYPLGPDLLLGIGRSANNQGTVLGLQIALFDVADPGNPAMLEMHTFGGMGSSSALDYSRHGVNILQSGKHARVALPVFLYQPQGGGDFPWGTGTKGLARFDIDTAAGSIVTRPLYTPASSDWSLWSDRALQTTNATYYLTGNDVIALPEN